MIMLSILVIGGPAVDLVSRFMFAEDLHHTSGMYRHTFLSSVTFVRETPLRILFCEFELDAEF